MKKIKLYTILLLLSGCYFFPCVFDDDLQEINKPIGESFVEGTYVLEKGFNTPFKNENAEIILNENGILELVDISSKTFFPYGSQKEKVVSAPGKWRLVYVESRDEYRLSINPKFYKKDSLENLMMSGKIYLKNNKPIVLFEIGDPDQCEAIRFIKKE